MSRLYDQSDPTLYNRSIFEVSLCIVRGRLFRNIATSVDFRTCPLLVMLVDAGSHDGDICDVATRPERSYIHDFLFFQGHAGSSTRLKSATYLLPLFLVTFLPSSVS
jgi:hypothetical protein